MTSEYLLITCEARIARIDQSAGDIDLLSLGVCVCRPDVPRKPSRAGARPAASSCPWAQDDDANMFARGPPSSNGLRGGRLGTKSSAVAYTNDRISYKPVANAGVPWAAGDEGAWEKPNNAYGAGIVGMPREVDLIRDDGDYEPMQYAQPSPMVRKPAQGAPWALDTDEPMLSVSQSSYRGGGSRGGIPPSRADGRTAAVTAKANKVRMQGQSGLLSWD